MGSRSTKSTAVQIINKTMNIKYLFTMFMHITQKSSCITGENIYFFLWGRTNLISKDSVR